MGWGKANWLTNDGFFLPPASGGSYSTEATQYFNRLPNDPGSTWKTSVAAFIDGLVSDSLWSLIDAAHIEGNTTSGNAAQNIRSSSATLTVTGAPTFTANSGYVGAASAQLDTNFNASTAGGQYAQNSCHAFIWTLTNFSSLSDYGSAFGLASATNTADLYPHYSDNKFYFYSQSTTADDDAAIAPGHFYGYTRTGASVESGWVDNNARGVGSAPSSALVNSNFVILNNNNLTQPFSGNVAFSCFGGGLNATQQGKLYTRVHALMQAICGAP